MLLYWIMDNNLTKKKIKEIEEAYIEKLREFVYAKISDYVNDKTVDQIVLNDLVKAHINVTISQFTRTINL
jgi:hypothetical protein